MRERRTPLHDLMESLNSKKKEGMSAGRGRESCVKEENTEGGGGRRVAWAGLLRAKKNKKKKEETGRRAQ